MKSVLQKYPDKFVGMCLADPTEGGGGAKEIERLIKEVWYVRRVLVLVFSTNVNCWKGMPILRRICWSIVLLHCTTYLPFKESCGLLQENFKGVRFNPYLWPSGEKVHSHRSTL